VRKPSPPGTGHLFSVGRIEAALDGKDGIEFDQ
jgi:hypothetical protein